MPEEEEKNPRPDLYQPYCKDRSMVEGDHLEKEQDEKRLPGGDQNADNHPPEEPVDAIDGQRGAGDRDEAVDGGAQDAAHDHADGQADDALALRAQQLDLGNEAAQAGAADHGEALNENQDIPRLDDGQDHQNAHDGANQAQEIDGPPQADPNGGPLPDGPAVEDNAQDLRQETESDGSDFDHDPALLDEEDPHFDAEFGRRLKI